ncbi:hypothetical protein GCM10010282_40800 [Streptomyces roseolus]|nr:hypothetical protein GCM10010282_40800 [Streptomyces roseolus]
MAHIRHMRGAPGVWIASVARMRLLVVVMAASKACAGANESPVSAFRTSLRHRADGRTGIPAVRGLRGSRSGRGARGGGARAGCGQGHGLRTGLDGLDGAERIGPFGP